MSQAILRAIEEPGTLVRFAVEIERLTCNTCLQFLIVGEVLPSGRQVVPYGLIERLVRTQLADGAEQNAADAAGGPADQEPADEERLDDRQGADDCVIVGVTKARWSSRCSSSG